MAEFFDLDPTLVRVLWFLSIFLWGIGILLYIGLAIIVPLEPLTDDEAAALAAGTSAGEPEGHRHASRGNGRVATFIGIGLMVLGAIALVDVLVPAWNDAWRYLWPAFLVAIGAILVAGAVRRESTNP